MNTLTDIAEGIIPQPVESWIDRIPRGLSMTVLVIVLALIATRVSRFMIRSVIRRVAMASLAGRRSRWVSRITRIGDETGAIREERRKLRIDGASRMVSHVVSLGIWVVATIAIFHFLDIDPTFYLSGAGFLGAGLAFGGQHKVNDYLTGLFVHFEDRYGVGDTITVETETMKQPVTGIVEYVGLFSTRVSADGTTFHFPNAHIGEIQNHSQSPAVTKLQVQVPANADAEQVRKTVREVAGTSGLTDVLFVADVEAYKPHQDIAEVEVRTPQPLPEKERKRLQRRVERTLHGQS